jgi:catechol 2,3-dioxygenase-like lactoylglutathione lyase family enzyme
LRCAAQQDPEIDLGTILREVLMTVKAGYSTPMLHAAEVERSIEFYEKLGFTVIDTDRGKPLGWARLHCEGGAVMFLRGEEPLEAPVRGLLLCMYTPDLPALREQLLAAAIKVPPIRYPEYMPSGEVQFDDPDGYSIVISHWGKAEQEAWEARIGPAGIRRRDPRGSESASAHRID